VGQIMTVGCPCGYSKSVTIGGGMRNFQTDSRFPYYCDSCGLVEVNIQAQPLACPSCQSQDLIRYGLAPVSLPDQGIPSVQWGRYEACRTGHLCPKCKQMTLEFKSTDIMFD
jgi:hypothetical protein